MRQEAKALAARLFQKASAENWPKIGIDEVSQIIKAEGVPDGYDPEVWEHQVTRAVVEKASGF